MFLTIDVESYTGDYAADVGADGLGLDYLLREVAGRGVRATFFMEALGSTQWGGSALTRLCRCVLEHGQDVQLHAHPVTARLDGFVDRCDTFWRQDRATQARLIGIARTALFEAGVSAPVAFRAGSLAANTDTLAAMEENGFRLGSNRDLDCKSSIESQLNEAFPVRNDFSQLGGVADLPVTVLRSPLRFLDGPYRHLEVCAVGALELTNALRRLQSAGYACATVLTHPAEFFMTVRGRRVPNQVNRRRLEMLLDFVSAWPGLRWCTLADCLARTTPRVNSPLIPRFHPLWSLLRVAEQAAKRSQTRIDLAGRGRR